MIQKLGFTGVNALMTPKKISVTKDGSNKPATQAQPGDIITSDQGNFLVLEKNNGMRLITPFEEIAVNDDQIRDGVVGGSLKLIG